MANFRLKPIYLVALLAILAPLAYISGRFADNFVLPGDLNFLATGAVATSLGALLGIPIGLFFGAFQKQHPAPIIHHHPDMIKQQDKILAQLHEELMQNRDLFEARRGNANFLTRIAYLTGFWTAAKASGQLFVMQEPKLLNTIATAYYWIEQANHLENLAYEAQFTAAAVADNQNASTHLISEARLLDGPLGISIQSAIDAINSQIKIDAQAPASSPTPQTETPPPASVVQPESSKPKTESPVVPAPTPAPRIQTPPGGARPFEPTTEPDQIL